MQRHRSIQLIALFILVLLQHSTSLATNLFFSTPGFVYSSQGGGSPYHLWTAGDYWQQTFTSTGVPSTTSLSLNLLFFDNDSAASSEVLNFNVLLNTVTVGTFAINPSDVGSIHQYNYSFPTILGGNYDIKMVATNTITPGAGSYSLSLGRSFELGSGAPVSGAGSCRVRLPCLPHVASTAPSLGRARAEHQMNIRDLGRDDRGRLLTNE